MIIEISEDGLPIRPTAVKPSQLSITESELLAGLTPYTAHADELPTLFSNETEE